MVVEVGGYETTLVGFVRRRWCLGGRVTLTADIC